MVTEIDEYIEANEQYKADMKWKQLMSEYLNSGYWPSEDECPHQFDAGRCQWCGMKAQFNGQR